MYILQIALNQYHIFHFSLATINIHHSLNRAALSEELLLVVFDQSFVDGSFAGPQAAVDDHLALCHWETQRTSVQFSPVQTWSVKSISCQILLVQFHLKRFYSHNEKLNLQTGERHDFTNTILFVSYHIESAINIEFFTQECVYFVWFLDFGPSLRSQTLGMGMVWLILIACLFECIYALWRSIVFK